MLLFDALKSFSHHGYAVIGDETIRDELISILEKKHKIRIQGNPDFFDRRYEVFGIDDARELKSLAETKPVNSNAEKIFILAMKGITVEAQNALLKLLEEPPSYARFFLIIPSAHLLLATIKSRIAVFEDCSKEARKSHPDREGIKALADEFLAASKAKRFELIKKLMDEISKEKRPKSDAIGVLNALEFSVYKNGVKKNSTALVALETARTYIYDRAPSLKMLLEYVAMSI